LTLAAFQVARRLLQIAAHTFFPITVADALFAVVIMQNQLPENGFSRSFATALCKFAVLNAQIASRCNNLFSAPLQRFQISC
jgi:hypothetical protein